MVAARCFAYAFESNPATGTFATFESQLTHLRTLAPQVLSFEFTETFSCGMLARDLARIEDPMACELILKNAANLEPESLSLVKLALVIDVGLHVHVCGHLSSSSRTT